MLNKLVCGSSPSKFDYKKLVTTRRYQAKFEHGLLKLHKYARLVYVELLCKIEAHNAAFTEKASTYEAACKYFEACDLHHMAQMNEFLDEYMEMTAALAHSSKHNARRIQTDMQSSQRPRQLLHKFAQENGTAEDAPRQIQFMTEQQFNAIFHRACFDKKVGASTKFIFPMEFTSMIENFMKGK